MHDRREKKIINERDKEDKEEKEEREVYHLNVQELRKKIEEKENKKEGEGEEEGERRTAEKVEGKKS